jgi:hypothetical protein
VTAPQTLLHSTRIEILPKTADAARTILQQIAYYPIQGKSADEKVALPWKIEYYRKVTPSGAHRVLVSRLDFKSSVSCQKREGWVRFPHAPANIFLKK